MRERCSRIRTKSAGMWKTDNCLHRLWTAAKWTRAILDVGNPVAPRRELVLLKTEQKRRTTLCLKNGHLFCFC